MYSHLHCRTTNELIHQADIDGNILAIELSRRLESQLMIMTKKVNQLKLENEKLERDLSFLP